MAQSNKNHTMHEAQQFKSLSSNKRPALWPWVPIFSFPPQQAFTFCCLPSLNRPFASILQMQYKLSLHSTHPACFQQLAKCFHWPYRTLPACSLLFVMDLLQQSAY